MTNDQFEILFSMFGITEREVAAAVGFSPKPHNLLDPDEPTYWYEVEPGLCLEFSRNDERLESLSLTIRDLSSGHPDYQGVLPLSLVPDTSRDELLSRYVPIRSGPPRKRPDGGHSGGFDFFKPFTQTNLAVYIGYDTQLRVCEMRIERTT